MELLGLLIENDPAYTSLRVLEPPSTVDPYRAGEADVAVAVACTTKAVGLAFTAERSRLSVALTHQRSGLVVVGDINAHRPDTGKGKGDDTARRSSRWRTRWGRSSGPAPRCSTT